MAAGYSEDLQLVFTEALLIHGPWPENGTPEQQQQWADEFHRWLALMGEGEYLTHWMERDDWLGMFLDWCESETKA